ncbi:MAG: hypothetical protein ACJ763_09800 [Bdellovibrionia bacterium]
MKKPRAACVLSALLILALASSSIAQAMPDEPPASFTLQEVPEIEADRIAPISNEFWDQYSAIGTPQPQLLDMGAIIIGTIALDAIVNIGKTVWGVIEAGRPKMNLDLDVASAVPQGIKSWTELDSWKDPIAKLYRTQLYSARKAYLGDVYYRLIFTYGGHYKGVGSYLTNVTVLPAQIQIGYHKDFYAQAKVAELVNHGTQKNPIAGMTLNLTWGMDGVFSKSMQSISFHVRGDGKVITLPSANDTAETIHAPVTTSKPTPKPKPKAVATQAQPAPKPTPSVVMVKIIPPR